MPGQRRRFPFRQLQATRCCWPLAAACLQQNKTVLSLAKELQQAGSDCRPSFPPPPNPAAAAQTYLTTSTQIALLQEQKNLMHHELETLQSLNHSIAEALQQKIAGKEQALQAAGRKIRNLAARTEMLQQRLTKHQAGAHKGSRHLKPRLLRFITQLWTPSRGQTRGSKA